MLFNHRLKHDHHSFKKKKQHELKPRKVLERETLEQGLNKPIDETNKGFKLLVKMGFKSDQQSTSKDQNMFQSPIAITIKENRIGLGMI